MSAFGRFLPVMQAISSITDWPLLGGSGHWDASSKSHVYDIHGRLLSAKGRHSLWLGGRAALAGIRSPRAYVPYICKPVTRAVFWDLFSHQQLLMGK